MMEVVMGVGEETFDLERAVCSHGLFMMAPNHWDPSTKTLSRPLSLGSGLYDDDTEDASSSTCSLMVRISHSLHHPHSLSILVYGTRSLSPQHQQALLGQVARMLRLSETDERNVREFQNIYKKKKKKNGVDGEADEESSFSGRVFRSPTLFEDMVKCILLCNCQWPRTLSMARALCELQLELQCHSSSVSVAEVRSTESKSPKAETENFIPNTPAGKASKRKLEASKVSTKLASKFTHTKAEREADVYVGMDCAQITTEKLNQSFLPISMEDDSCENSKSCHTETKLYKADSCLLSDLQFHEGSKPYAYNRIGNFPSPRELASLDESFLAKRCNLGYRASRILKLAQSIVEGRIRLRQLEEVCKGERLSGYDKLAKQLKGIYGFGPFTCANVLMCMGFYHVIPTDSETVRHLKQVHARKSTIQTVQRDVEEIYGKYAPFQFLAYWSELWHFYEKGFGKLSEMPCSDYKLITSSNMKSKGSSKKRTKLS